jgi:xanthine dehydrogenase iron-sulfur cluster and FAD-binding subunit A
VKPFDYIAVETIAEACGVLAAHGPDVSILAGGTDLLIELRRASTKAPKLVLDISAVPELGGIDESDGSITVKPLATHTRLMRSDLLQTFAPLLASAASTIGSPQIRDRGTVGGNIMNAAACADTVPPLIALGATVTLQSKRGSRELALADLFVKPYQTKASPDELLIAIRFPKLSPSARSAFIKLGRRNALSISRLSVAAILQVGHDGRIAEARIVPGAAFPTWKRATDAERMLIGEKPAEKLFAAAGQKVSEEMIKATGRRWSTEYKEPVIAVLVRRALEQCASKVGQRVPPARSAGAASRRGQPGRAALRSTPSSSHAQSTSRDAKASREYHIKTTINGRSQTLTVPPNRTLLNLLREHLGLLGTKCGCEIGECGACTVLLDGEPVNSCLVLAPQIDGREVLTVEGLEQNGKLHPLQESFLDHDAVHCGFCTSGMLLSAKALLDWNPRPTETEIRTAISGNLCRCTGYQQIVQAIAKAAR